MIGSIAPGPAADSLEMIEGQPLASWPTSSSKSADIMEGLRWSALIHVCVFV